MNIGATIRYWLRGVRLYIALAILLLSGLVALWGRVGFGASNLATIRVQEAYGWLSLGLLILALLIGPVLKVWPNLPGKQPLREARRLIGVGAAWFALLHAAVAYLGQFHASNPLRLPRFYQQALLLGAVGLLTLMALALTSFNRAMRVMGMWWFRLHRLIYVTALAAVMHAFMVGAHATGTGQLIGFGGLAALWIGLNLYLLIREPGTPSTLKIITLSYGTFLLLAVLNYGLTQHLGYNALVDGHSDHGAVLEQARP